MISADVIVAAQLTLARIRSFRPADWLRDLTLLDAIPIATSTFPRRRNLRACARTTVTTAPTPNARVPPDNSGPQTTHASVGRIARRHNAATVLRERADHPEEVLRPVDSRQAIEGKLPWSRARPSAMSDAIARRS